MPVTELNTIKSWFENGDFPNQDQFWAWLDSFYHKQEEIPMAAIDGLANLLAGKATVQDIDNVNIRIDGIEGSAGAAVTERAEHAQDVDYLLPDGQKLDTVVIIPVSTITLSVGTTPGGDEIAPAQVYPFGVASEIFIGKYANGDTHIYFTGIPSATKFIFYKRK